MEKNIRPGDRKKEQLRRQMKDRRMRLSREERERASKGCLQSLKKLPDFLNSKWVYAYMSCKNELDTGKIISWCFSQGKRIAVPKVLGKIMHFYEITSLADCVPGAYKIMEPDCQEGCPEIVFEGFMLVPGLAFDRKKNRLGYGGGFYDRYLSSHKNIVTAGLGYDFQLVEEVPSEEHDRKLDYIIIS